MRQLTLFALLPVLMLGADPGFAESIIPAHIKEKMNGYVGTWEFAETQRATQSAAPLKVTGKWEAKWYSDNLIEWRATYTHSEGTGANTEYEGFDPVILGYSYWFDTNGSRGQLFNGTWQGNTFGFDAVDVHSDGTRVRQRCQFHYSEDFTVIDRYQCETHTGGNWWLSREGSARKISSQ
jgi:hypothetical protein